MSKLVHRLVLACALAAFDAAAAPTACDLLSAAEVQSVQGEPLKEAKLESATHDGLAVSQCYYALPTLAKSISLTLTTRGEGAAGRSPRESWRQTFHRRKDEAAEKKREAHGEEEENEAAPALKRLGGLGEEAYWEASPVGGSLYVLKGQRFIRISVGGPGDAAQKTSKSRTLARLALKRLH